MITFRGVARLVVIRKPPQIKILSPRNPLLVLRVVRLPSPFHLGQIAWVEIKVVLSNVDLQSDGSSDGDEYDLQ